MAKRSKSPILVNNNAKVKDVMQTDLITVKFDTFLADAIQKMKERGVSGLVVLDNIGEFVGVISALDVFKTVNEENQNIQDLRVENVMTPFTITIDQGESLTIAASTMMENNIHRLVVTESPTSKKPLGIITSTDLINNLL